MSIDRDVATGTGWRPATRPTADDIDRLLSTVIGPVEVVPDRLPVRETWVPVGEASRATGVSKSAIRVWYRTDQIPSRIAPGPHGDQRLVPLEAVRARARQAGKEPDMARNDVDEGAVVELARLAIEQAAERERAAIARAERAEARLETLESELRDLIARAATAEAALSATRAAGPTTQAQGATERDRG